MLGKSLLPKVGSILVTSFLAFLSRGDGWSAVPATSAFSIHRQYEPTLAVVTTRKTCGRCYFDSPTTLLAVNAPKRRKRKSPSNDDSADDDSLPDFDIADDVDSSSVSSSTSGASSSSTSSLSTTNNKQTSSNGVYFNEITPEMMGSSYMKKTTVSDLIRDRSLESKFQFDEEDTDDSTLPDLALFPNTASEPLGKKQARKAARMAAAAAAQKKKEEEEEGNILSKIPFIRDEKGEVSALKILENGTWLGIGLLVGWELYINSPFFDRAQPMIPVIYDIVWFT